METQTKSTQNIAYAPYTHQYHLCFMRILYAICGRNPCEF